MTKRKPGSTRSKRLSNNMKKAYFFDMDGTLYSHRFHEVPPNTLKALYQLKEQGHLVCLATSRTAQELAHLEQEVRTFPFDYRIIDGGAVVLDRNGKCVKKTVIAPHIIDRIASWCRRTGTPWRYACEDGMWWDIEGSQKEHDILFSLYLAVPERKRTSTMKSSMRSCSPKTGKRSHRSFRTAASSGMVRAWKYEPAGWTRRMPSARSAKRNTLHGAAASAMEAMISR